MLKYKRGCINDTASRKLMIVVSPTFERGAAVVLGKRKLFPKVGTHSQMPFSEKGRKGTASRHKNKSQI